MLPYLFEKSLSEDRSKITKLAVVNYIKGLGKNENVPQTLITISQDSFYIKYENREISYDLKESDLEEVLKKLTLSDFSGRKHYFEESTRDGRVIEMTNNYGNRIFTNVFSSLGPKEYIKPDTIGLANFEDIYKSIEKKIFSIQNRIARLRLITPLMITFEPVNISEDFDKITVNIQIDSIQVQSKGVNKFYPLDDTELERILINFEPQILRGRKEYRAKYIKDGEYMTLNSRYGSFEFTNTFNQPIKDLNIEPDTINLTKFRELEKAIKKLVRESMKG